MSPQSPRALLSTDAASSDGRAASTLQAKVRAAALLLFALLLLALPQRSAARPLAPAASTGLVLNELDYVQPGGKGVDFVEILNTDKQPVSLGGHSLKMLDGLGQEIVSFDLPAYPLQPGELFVVCGMPFVPNCDWVAADGADIVPGSGIAGQAHAAALLQQPARGGPAVLVDTVSFDGSVPGGPVGGGTWTEGKGLSPADDGADEPSFGISRRPDGRDTDENSTDFVPACASPGLPNSTAAKDCRPAVQERGLVVNEADIDQRGTDQEEFVELKNLSGQPVDLGRYEVVGVDAGSDIYRRVPLPGQLLPPGEHYVICPANGQVPNCDLTIQPTSELWHGLEPDQLPAAIAVLKRNDEQQDMAVLVDSLSYGTRVDGGPTAGGAWTEGSAASPADNLGVTNLGLSRSPDGTDTGDNLKDFKLRCSSPGLANSSLVTSCPRPAQTPGLVVNELDVAQEGADKEEFVEIKNRGSVPVALGDFDLVLVDSKGQPYNRLDLPPRLLAPGAYHVLCNAGSSVPNCDQPDLPEQDALRDRDGNQPLGAVALLRDPVPDPKEDRDDILEDSVSYEGDVPGGPATGGTWTETSGPGVIDPAASLYVTLARLVDGIDTQSNKNDIKQACASPGYVNAPRPLTGAACDGPVPVTETPAPSPTATATEAPTREPSPSPTASATASATSLPTRTPGPTLDPREPTATSGPRPTDPPSGQERSYRVDSAGLSADRSPGDGICQDSSGACSLQAALEEVNADTGADAIRISFAPGLGPILLTSGRSLPALKRQRVILDGALTPSQAGLTLDATAGRGDLPQQGAPTCGALQELTGPGSGVGLTVQAGQAAIQGLRISGFDTGILADANALGLRIGADGDGLRDGAECNALWDHRLAAIRLDGARQVWVTGNHIGIQAGGDPGALSRTGAGVLLTGGASANLVGKAGARLPKPGLGNRIQNLETGILVTGRTTEGNLILGNQLGPAVARNWDRYANVTGIQLSSFARGTLIGGSADGADTPELANSITYNLRDGIAIERSVLESSLRGNEIRANRRDGVRLGQTVAGGNTLRGNRITANGGAAIAVEALALELAPPSIDWVDRVRGQVGGKACAGCIIEVFSDPMDEARTLLARGLALPDGSWSLSGLDLLAISDPTLTATATDANGNSSRLSEARPLTDPWRLIEIPYALPRALRPGQPIFERRFRLVDHEGANQSFATVRFSPLNLFFMTDGRGEVKVEIPLQSLLAAGSRVMSFTVEAVDRSGNLHAVFWNPRLVLGWQQAASRPGDAVLDLSSLMPNGVGGLLRRANTLSTLQQALGLTPPSASAPFAARLPSPDQGDTDGYGAAYAASPTSELREGQYAWQMNLAQGGGIYQLQAAGEPLTGLLEITAPAAAFNDGSSTAGDRRSSACPAGTQGATIAGWKGDIGCWTPIIGTSAAAPAAGAPTFKASAQVSVSSFATTLDRLDPARALQAMQAITLYTVGFDLTAPSVQWRLAAGSTIRRLPPSLAELTDSLAGVDATSISLKLGGLSIPATFDPDTLELRIPPEGQTPPPGVTGPTLLELTVKDGFCNQTSSSLSLTIDPQAPPSQAGLIIYTPYMPKGHSIK